MKNKKIISNVLIWGATFFVLGYSIYKLYQSNWTDWQHWGVLIASIVLIIGNVIRGMR